jgi:selenocysteine lyase/cysteine desulfurase
VKEIFHDRRFQEYAFLEDARKFELGYPSYPSIYAMNCSTGLLLETGIDRIEKHILELGGGLIRELAGRGYQVMTPEAPEKRAGNIAISFERGGELADALRQQGVLVWGGDGRFRASIHGYNDSADIDRLLETLSDHAGSFR